MACLPSLCNFLLFSSPPSPHFLVSKDCMSHFTLSCQMSDAVGLEVEAYFSSLFKESSGLRKVPYTVLWISQEGGGGCARKIPPEVLASSLSIPSLNVFLQAPGRGARPAPHSPGHAPSPNIQQSWSERSLRPRASSHSTQKVLRRASYVPAPCQSCGIDRKNKEALAFKDWQSVWGDKIYTVVHGF